MRLANLFLAALTLLAGAPAPATAADENHGSGPQGPVYVIAHLDVLPMTVGGVDFLQSGYALLFGYREASRSDAGLESFRILNLVAPTPNHSQIVQSWSSYEAYQRHLSQSHTTRFRFEVQNNPRFGGICCVGSPIDDRQYSLVQSFGAPWSSPALAATVGPSGPVFIISYVEFLPREQPEDTQRALTRYGERAQHANTTSLMSYTVLRELLRPARYAILEVWSNRRSYDGWQTQDATLNLNLATTLRPLLGSPIDRRFTILCGKTYVDGVGCTAP